MHKLKCSGLKCWVQFGEDTEHFFTPKIPPRSTQLPTPRISLGPDVYQISFSYKLVFPTLEFLIDGPHGAHVSIEPHSLTVFLRFTHDIVCISGYPVVWLKHSVFPFILHWWAPGLLSLVSEFYESGCYEHSHAIIFVKIFSFLSGRHPKNRIAGS